MFICSIPFCLEVCICIAKLRNHRDLESVFHWFSPNCTIQYISGYEENSLYIFHLSLPLSHSIFALYFYSFVYLKIQSEASSRLPWQRELCSPVSHSASPSHSHYRQSYLYLYLQFKKVTSIILKQFFLPFFLKKKKKCSFNIFLCS